MDKNHFMRLRNNTMLIRTNKGPSIRAGGVKDQMAKAQVKAARTSSLQAVCADARYKGTRSTLVTKRLVFCLSTIFRLCTYTSGEEIKQTLKYGFLERTVSTNACAVCP